MRGLSAFFKRFSNAEEGSQTIPFVVMMPLLVWSIMAMLTFTDAFRARAMATDATAVIADSLSRQTTPIYTADLVGLKAVVKHLTGYDVALRVTQLRCTRNCNDLNQRRLAVDFSQGIELDPLRNRHFRSDEERSRIPFMARGDRLILVETSFMHEPLAKVGLDGREVNVSHTTRMRFTPRLCWETCN